MPRYTIFLLISLKYIWSKQKESIILLCLKYTFWYILPLSVQFSWWVLLTFCNPMDCSMPGFPVHHQLPKLSQTHVHPVCDAMQPSQPLSSPSPPTFNLSQHQRLFKWVSSSHQVAKVLELQLQQQFFQWIFTEDPLEKEVATHSSILAWEIPQTEEPGGLQSMGSQKSQTQLIWLSEPML